MTERQIIRGMWIGLVLFSSCYYDVEEKLYPVSDCVTTNMSYQNDIAPILERNCYGCHSLAANTANVTVEGHAKLMEQILNGKLIGVINHAQGFKPMPQAAPKLRTCDIDKIEAWVSDGAPNN